MSVAERVVGRMVTANNERMTSGASDAGADNPRPLERVAWAQALARAHTDIRREWVDFASGGGRLPHIEDLIDEDQGADGAWRAGLLVSRGRSVGPLAARFPRTLDALDAVPGLWSALWSVLEPGAELAEHTGPNAGMLRYHLGVVSRGETALWVDGVTTPYVEAEGILFDDTAPHAAWNRGPAARVTLFCEVLRPATGARGMANRAVQELIALDPRYRRAPRRAAEWHMALNPGGDRALSEGSH